MAATHQHLILFATIIVVIWVTTRIVHAEFMYKSYQHSITCYSQHPPRSPRSLTEIQDILRYAIAYDMPIKVLGNRHSISDSICTSGIPINMTNIKHFAYDPTSTIAKVGAGMEVGDFLEKLHQYGRAVSAPPDYGGVTVGGALANGAHGTTIKYPATLSQQIVALTVVDGRGKVRRITENEEIFKAFRVSLGLLGVIYEAEFVTVPQFKLLVRHFPLSDGIIRNGTDIVKMAREYDHFQFWWFPTNRQIVFAVGSRLPVHEPGNCETRMVPDMSWFTVSAMSTAVEIFQATRDDITMFNIQSYVQLALYKNMPGTDPIFVEDDGETPCLDETIGYGHRLTNNKCQECAWQWDENLVTNEDIEIAIPLHKLMPALRTLGEIFEKQLVQFPGRGVRVRFLTAGDAYMAMNEGVRDWVAIEWVTAPRWDKQFPKLGIAAYQAMGQVLVEQYGGRPHWGKCGLYYSSSRIIRKAHPSLDKFIEVMKEYDPQELFMNTFGERIKHGKDRFTVTSEMAEHCALNEVCICKTNYDCGMEGLLDYRCGPFMGFPSYNVCLPGVLETMKEAYTRPMIGLMATFEYNEESVVGYLKQFSLLNDILVSKKKSQPVSIKSTSAQGDTTVTGGSKGHAGGALANMNLKWLKAFH